MTEKRGMKALELWCRKVTEGYPGVKIENMTTSWRDGLAFCALIHHFRPDLIDFDRLDKRDIYKNNELAFRIAERQLGIPALLDAEDMVEYEVPDRLSILTYLSQFYQTFVSSQQGTADSSPKSHSPKVSEMISPSTKTPKASKVCPRIVFRAEEQLKLGESVGSFYYCLFLKPKRRKSSWETTVDAFYPLRAAKMVGAGRLESCWSCRRPVFLAERLVAGGKVRHRTCFTCKRCGHQLNLVGCYETEEGDFVCETCPDEEKRDEGDSRSAVSKGELEEDEEDSGEGLKDSKDEYSLNFESALDSIVASCQNEAKSKFLQDLVDGSSDFSETTMDSSASKSMSNINDESLGFESLSRDKFKDDVKNSFPVVSVNKNQHSTASIENLNIKIKSLLGRDFSETLSLLSEESDSFVADVAEIIDSIIDDAVKDTENRVRDSSATTLSLPCEKKESAEIAVSDTPSIKTIENDDVAIAKKARIKGEISELKESQSIISKEVIPEIPKKDLKSQTEDYPEDLNPFADDDDDDDNKERTAPVPVKPPVTPRKTPVPAARTKTSQPVVFNKSGQKIIEAPVVNLNPFWSDGEPSSDEEVAKPIPSPRSTSKYLEQGSPFSRSQYGSYTSLNSVGSSASTFRKKKALAPPPPSDTKHLQHPGSPDSVVSSLSGKSSSPTPTIRSHRKSKPAPPPPLKSDESGPIIEKKDKNYENKVKQNLSVPDKSSYGKWKRKKGQAPGLPIPQRRRITPLPLPELYRELEDLEIQQRELERQGVTIEQTIRKFESESLEEEEKKELEGKDVEGLIIQLFEIVNQKNELFRRQAELMYLRRQQRLEEEHADLEYQIRCLMGRPERNKTDSDKEQEEELIKRLVEVVERRNEIIECLDMDRKREVEEDESIHHHLEAFAGKKGMSEDKDKPKHAKSSPSLLKYMKKKKSIKGKNKEGSSVKARRDADKDIDEANKDEEVKVLKAKKKWFVKL